MSLHYKANGTLDMRFSSSKAYVASHGSLSSSSGLHYRQDGGLDMRYKSSKQEMERLGGTTSSSTPRESKPSVMTESDIILNKDGTVNRNSKAVRSGEIRLRQDGKIDQRCSAYRQGRLILTSDGNPDAQAMHLTRRSRNRLSESEQRPSWFDSIYDDMEPIVHRVDTSSGTERPSQALQERINSIARTTGTEHRPAEKKVVDALTIVKYKPGVCLNEQCPVCFDDMQENTDIIVTRCKHGFHPECIRPWLKSHSTCPFCRQEVRPN